MPVSTRIALAGQQEGELKHVSSKTKSLWAAAPKKPIRFVAHHNNVAFHVIITRLPISLTYAIVSVLTSQQVVFVAPCKGGKKETELYWRWVEEVKPPLPRDFRHKFHMAAILLKVRQTFSGERMPSDQMSIRKGPQDRHTLSSYLSKAPWAELRWVSSVRLTNMQITNNYSIVSPKSAT